MKILTIIIILLAIKGFISIVNDIDYEIFIRKYPDVKEKAMKEFFKGIYGVNDKKER